MLFHKKIIQYFEQWEYRPSRFFHIPTLIIHTYYSLRARHLFFISAVNPSIYFGGFAGEDKKQIQDMLPQTLVPKTIIITMKLSINDIIERMGQATIIYPCVLKPNTGSGKGADVAILKNTIDMLEYMQEHNLDTREFLLQEYCAMQEEYGVFYIRYPREQSGYILGVVQKCSLSIIGDGIHTLIELIHMHPRAYRYIEDFGKLHGKNQDRILDMGEMLILSTIGNHARGSLFLDVSHKISSKLEQTFDEISKNITGFYLGRYDIKAESRDDLERGDCMIIELNGTGSEPTWIYDPSYKLLHAYKMIHTVWKSMYDIARYNRLHGTKYISYSMGIKTLLETFKKTH